MKKKLWFLMAGLIIIAVGSFWFWRTKNKSKKMESDTVETAALGAIERTVDATGEVTPLNRVEIKPPISGRLEELIASEGAHVKKGDILAWMSSSDRAAILDAARAGGPAEVRRWEDTYKPTPIIAPLSGVIILREVVVGQTVDASTVLFAMSDRLIVKAQVDEADIGRVKLGLPARVVLDAYPDRVIQARVFQILFEGKNVSNVITYGVKIEPAVVPPFFRSQMTANVTLILEHKENALLIPSKAVHQSREGNFVRLQNADGTTEKKTVITGLDNGDKTEIVQGLSAGDNVIISKTKYTPQKDPQNSPLAMGGRRPPEQRNTGAQSGRRGQ